MWMIHILIGVHIYFSTSVKMILRLAASHYLLNSLYCCCCSLSSSLQSCLHTNFSFGIFISPFSIQSQSVLWSFLTMFFLLLIYFAQIRQNNKKQSLQTLGFYSATEIRQHRSRLLELRFAGLSRTKLSLNYRKIELVFLHCTFRLESVLSGVYSHVLCVCGFTFVWLKSCAKQNGMVGWKWARNRDQEIIEKRVCREKMANFLLSS